MLKDNFTIQIKCFYGFESILAKEVQSIGGAKVITKNRMVECQGDLGFLYKANYSLRTALRIIIPIFKFKANDENQLYQKLVAFNWEHYMDLSQSFLIDSTVYSDEFTHSHFAALKTKDALVDFFQNEYEKRPNVEKTNPNIRFHLHIYQNQVTLSLDSSGESLHRRGYRIKTGEAPINEVLAAGLLNFASWDGKGSLLDPMCGSGTILIEAAMMAMKIPAQLHRETFAFEEWKNFDADLWNQIKETRIKKISEFHGKIIGYDLDHEMVEIAQENIKNSDLEEFIEIKQRDFFTSQKELFPLQIIFNPPYDERLEQNDPDFYRNIGDTLKHKYPNTLTWFITGDLLARKNIGLKPNKRIKLYNGKLECDYLCYETYEGSKKLKKNLR